MIMADLPHTLTPSKIRFYKLKDLTMKLKEGKLKEWNRKMKD